MIGLGFSTGRPLDIRAGGGEDEVQYNVNAPVSVDGGTGFDKLVVLGTEFADDFAITDKAIYGAGLNVRYTTVEVHRGRRSRGRRPVLRPVDRVRRRLPRHRRARLRHDQRDRRRHRRHRHARARGPIGHRRPPRHVADRPALQRPARRRPRLQPRHPGRRRRRHQGERRRHVGARGRLGRRRGHRLLRRHARVQPGLPRRSLHDLGASRNVYVTVSAARSPAGRGATARSTTRRRSPNGMADTIWLCLGDGARSASATSRSSSSATRSSTAPIVDENGRAVVLTFDWRPTGTTPQRVYIWAVDTLDGIEIDPRSEGDRVVVIQHSVISNNPLFDGALVRKVEATVYDNDTPGVYVTQIEKAAVCPGPPCTEDERTVVVEGSIDPAVGGHYTGTDDDLLIQLAMRPGRRPDRRRQALDGRRRASRRSRSSSSASTARWAQHAGRHAAARTTRSPSATRRCSRTTGRPRSASASSPATTRAARTRRPPSSATRATRRRRTAGLRQVHGLPDRDVPVPEPALRPGHHRRSR